ncbi:MAG: ABC transporter permease [Lentisphaeria bacterium]
MFSLLHTIRTAFLDLSLHKVRSAMAATGVMFGVGSVITMMAVSEGAKQESLQRIVSMGVDNIILRSRKPHEDNNSTSADDTAAYKKYGIRHHDLDHIRQTVHNLKTTVAVKSQRWPVRDFRGDEQVTPVIATENSYLDLSHSRMKRGRFIQSLDNLERRRVCVLGKNAARRLFAFYDPLGKLLQINNQWFRVTGILKNAEDINAFGTDAPMNNHIFIPLETSRSLYGDVRPLEDQKGFAEVQLDAAVLQVADKNAIQTVTKHLHRYLEKEHAAKDYELVVPLALLKQKAATQKVFSIVMGAIAGISLLVGGIGIMNIMLANVSERRKEIGMRRALGARRQDVLVQFLIEAMTLTGFGGVVGIALGYTLTAGITHYADMAASVPLWSVALGLGVSVGVGMVFGLWPAYNAAAVSPIDALRFE